jgi:hypothetical protein
MERELGISYPTVRGRVDALLRALGLGDGPAADELDIDQADDDAERDRTEEEASIVADQRRAILERLARREIAADEAAAALRELGAS